MKFRVEDDKHSCKLSNCNKVVEKMIEERSAKTIKELRKKTKLTQEQFAETYSIPLSTLRKWEQGKSTCPSHMIELLKIKIISSTTEYTHYTVNTFERAYLAHMDEISKQEENDRVMAFFAWCRENKAVLDEVQRVLSVGEQVKSMLENEQVIKELRDMVSE